MNAEINQQLEVGRKAMGQKQGKGETDDGKNGGCHLRQKLVSFSFSGDFVLGEKRIFA